MKARKTVARELAKQSGIVEDITDYNRLLTGRRHHRKGVPQVVKKENQKKPDAEKEAKGEVVRMKAMESIGQTKKTKSRTRVTGDDAQPIL